ncbi:MAG: transglutaminase domain-containing protein [Eubacteriales bacterium]|nr:transglutaminase domain-containing protein [Eubacteriales bacterium]
MEKEKAFMCGRREQILRRYQELEEKLPLVFAQVSRKLEACDEDTALACKYLYGTMPYSDMGNYPFETFLDYGAHGVRLWKTNPDVQALPEDIFLNYVLYHRVNEEEIVPCRSLFYDKVRERIQGMHGKEAALEVNYWCVEEATYNCTDDRTLSALAVYRRGTGRCGEESTFSVNVLRSAGIPARQVYAPKWSHCDDNHAWVEVWCDGTWYFTGACEPVPILNKGWFTNAASRAMMVHSRWFDNVPSGGEVIGNEGMVTMLNELKRYARVKEITVKVENSAGEPVQGANVALEVLNYSEYAPVAQAVTDVNGCVTLTTGYGSLHIQVYSEAGNGIWGTASGEDKEESLVVSEAYMDTRTQDECVVCLKNQPPSHEWKAVDMIAPVDTPVNTAAPTEEQNETGKRRLALAAEKRKKKTENWTNPERDNFLKAEGSPAGENRADLRRELMQVLTEKDQTDCIREVLEEHLKYALPYEEESEHDIFVSYVLNPRVDDEILRKYREAVLTAFTQEEQNDFRRNPRAIWEAVDKRIQSCPECERSSVITTPEGCLKTGMGSQLSKEILFVAAARTLGIPARLNPSDRSMEYMENNEFVPVLGEAEKNCRLILRDRDHTVWKYFQNWSIARLTQGNYVSMKLGDRSWENNSLTLMVEAGRYRIITSNRLPNGNVFANQYEFCVEPGEEKEVELVLRQADLNDMLENIAIPQFCLHTESGRPVNASELTEDGKHILMFLEESKEPTEHILNEMMEQEQAFAACASRIIFVIRSKEALNDPTLSKALALFPDVQIYYDDFTDNINMLGRRMYVDHEKLPLIIVTDGALNGIYATSGYNVGTGDMLLRIM